MAKAMYAGDSGFKAQKITAGYIGDANNKAQKISKVYMGDANGIAQLVWQAISPLVVNYTGTYTDEVVQMTDGTYRLLTLTGSGTLTFSQQVECDIWLCGSGASGGNSTKTSMMSLSSGGGGGGYCLTLFAKIIKEIIVSIGAGGVGGANGISASGSATSIAGDISATINGGNTPNITGTTTATMTLGGDGGSGGGSGYAAGGTPYPGKGQGTTTRPFGDSAQDPLCAGGAGALKKASSGVSVSGYDGGTDGSDGKTATADQNGVGGAVGGGSGAAKVAANGEAATDYGSGGGGKAMSSSATSYSPGAGYQGCVMVRVKLNDEGLDIITFTIAGVSYIADTGMTWGEWVVSSYNTGGFAIASLSGVSIIVQGSGSQDPTVKNGNTLVQSGSEIIANTAYTLSS